MFVSLGHVYLWIKWKYWRYVLLRTNEEERRIKKFPCPCWPQFSQRSNLINCGMVQSLNPVSVLYKMRQMTFSGLSMFDLDIQNIRVKFGVVIFKYKKNYICEYSIFYGTVLALWLFLSVYFFLFFFHHHLKITSQQTFTWYVTDTVLVSLLLTLNIFHTFLWGFYCSAWTSKCLLG